MKAAACVLLFLAGSVEAADLCAPTVLVGATPAELGEPARPCTRADVGLRLQGDALVDVPDYYGFLVGRLTLRGGGAPFEGPWRVFGALDLATVRYAVNAVVEATRVSAGPLSVGVGRVWSSEDGSRRALGFVRVLLPFDGARRTSTELALEPGVSGAFGIGARTFVRGHLSLPLGLVESAGVVRTSQATSAALELAWGPRPWLLVAGGAHGRALVAPDPALRTVAARLAATFVRASGWAFACGAEAPLFGQDRTDLRVALLLGYEGPRP